ncbi:hypothetical protein K458DRAFT_148562 [Lentithecium fluviatile CBS 122367]|uniref:Uncharacterized protein n=1 Tax=Lentithecium fluviatile CBS 122367 TaxID=1168545 RepID=A0A6G1JE28_9PLEO|nr:hypothetical protein K458DRAFT_148562 [Lentithecium fluviatile CBS 122367]
MVRWRLHVSSWGDNLTAFQPALAPTIITLLFVFSASPCNVVFVSADMGFYVPINCNREFSSTHALVLQRQADCLPSKSTFHPVHLSYIQ